MMRGMSKPLLPIGTALLLLALAGCQAKPSVVGKWKGKSISGLPSGTETEKMVKKMSEESVTKLELEFKGDGSAVIGGGGGTTVEGKYTLVGNQVTFTMDTSKIPNYPKGQPAPKPVNLTLSADGKSLTMSGDNPGVVTLEKVP
jgi:hypothetical protein